MGCSLNVASDALRVVSCLGWLTLFLHAAGAGKAEACTSRFPSPPAPVRATDHNGIKLGDACFKGPGPHHVFVIGDWGGVMPTNPGEPVRPAVRGVDATHNFVQGVDDWAQQRVAEQMAARANQSAPDYILNVGDNFYWGGIEASCGAAPYQPIETGQWQAVFEEMYTGQGIDGKQWLGVLGNHDYGGRKFTAAWDQIIGYTWERPPPWSGRWMTPAQYWYTTAKYSDFSVDYFFVDTNVFYALPMHDSPHNNLCGMEFNPPGASCGPQGPTSIATCVDWFEKLWKDQQVWLERSLAASKAEWQIVVTHFPPTWGTIYWQDVAKRYGIDLMITGHVHYQKIDYGGKDSMLGETALVISGGGGGIVSEGPADNDGHDDEYGFVDMTLSKETILVEAISHGGQVRKSVKVRPRKRKAALPSRGSKRSS